MTTRIHFLYQIDMWSRDGEEIIEHLAGVEDFPGSDGDLSGSLRALAGDAHHVEPRRAGD